MFGDEEVGRGLTEVIEEGGSFANLEASVLDHTGRAEQGSGGEDLRCSEERGMHAQGSER